METFHYIAFAVLYHLKPCLSKYGYNPCNKFFLSCFVYISLISSLFHNACGLYKSETEATATKEK